MKIIFCIPDLGCGGAERVVANLANEWSKNNSITIITLTPQSRDFYEFHPSISRKCIDRKKTRWYQLFSQFSTIMSFRKLFKEINPDYILSFLPKTNILTLSASFFTVYKVIACERNIINDPDIDSRQHFIRGLLYRHSYKITVQHSEILSELVETYPYLKRERIIITPNPVNVFKSSNTVEIKSLFPDYSSNDHILIGVGRFTPTKAFKDLLRVFSLIHKKDETIRLVIFGEGPEYGECKELLHEHNLEKYVALPGQTNDINSWFAVSDIFVTTTYYEGFPNALAEALSAGLPSIAFNSPSLSVFIHDGKNGFIIPGRDKEQMAQKTLELISDLDMYQSFSINAQRISEEYSFDKVNKIWLDEVLV